jgi:predicted secreted hydrolase
MRSGTSRPRIGRRGVWILAAGSFLLLGGAIVATLIAHGGAGREAPVRTSLSVAAAMGAGDESGFARAEAPRDLVFPADHGPHPDFRTEWWYFTGNVGTRDGRHFGFQLTFFRVGLAPGDGLGESRRSAWAAGQVYLAHFALTDTAGRTFRAWSRSERAALGLAGARPEPLRVWVDHWSVEAEGAAGLSMRLRASEPEAAIDLVLYALKPLTLQGERGWSRKGPEPGNASFYYSFTRMAAKGSIRVGAATFPVSGLAWMDREWSTSALGPELAGWDWFALHLDDGRDVMVYQLRRRDGTPDPLSAGVVVGADGRSQSLAREDFRIEVLDEWRSPASRVRYPSRWRLTLHRDALTLDLTPRLPDQELLLTTRYWEGAVAVESAGGEPRIAGRGYVELVGYGE